ncbi:nitrate/nitrite transporter [Haloactinomyces albus]|uniref:NNP family nitrate/nitrite transporter-like MFS transporter n=1 Tax=Haloactinomyces albus TaxID=1352928 RepID=A0AAE4CS85_9ACTN|nr:nitrate/nitrite transporter [Haloactinomyces albus]MDR7304423.1 NNP family nitrate/nitrite transporter-like MFS transporter [Haloactinomyces albus]
METTTTASATPPTGNGGWITGWDPEDEEFWERSGKRIARRNLWLSLFSEHVGFSVWSIWSVMVLFMSPEIGLGFTAGEKFLLVTIPSLVGALLRIPYSYGVTRFGGRNWTVFSTSLLLIPTVLTAVFVMRPGTPLWVFLLIGALTGVGGGNFASSMTNITNFFPQRHQGWALGLNAGGGNIGVAVIQLVGLLVIATAGSTSPVHVAAVYLPLIVVAALLAALRMDNIDAVRRAPGMLAEAVRRRHTWWLSFLYIGTFGSFIGYSFAFGLVLKSEFDFTALQAAGYTFIGPLLGSLARPVGGRLSDRWGGARVTFWNFLGMAAGTGLLLVASAQNSFPLYLASFIALFILTGIGNGSVYTMIPAVFARQAENAVASGGSAVEATALARKLSGTVMGIAGAVGCLGGVFINLTFRVSFGGAAANGDTALTTFLVFYLVCVIATWAIYLRRGRARVPVAERAAVAAHKEAADV